VSRSRAADDFPAIRARLEELRRERGDKPEPVDDRAVDVQRSDAVVRGGVPSRSLGPSWIMRRTL
jgi:hypothetical protein